MILLKPLTNPVWGYRGFAPVLKRNLSIITPRNVGAPNFLYTSHRVMAKSRQSTLLKRCQVRFQSDQKKTASGQSTFKDIMQLLRLAKPEWRLLSIGVVALLVTSAGSMVMPSIMGKVIDTATENEGNTASFKILGHEFTERQFYTGVGVVFLVTAVANYGRIYLLKKIGERVVYRLRSTIVRNLFYQDSKFWDLHKSGDLISRLVSDSTIIAKSVTLNLSDGLRGTIQGVVGLTMMVFISTKLTGYMILMFIPIVLIGLLFGRKVRLLSKLTQEQLGSLTRISEEQFSFIKTMQSYGREEFEVKKYTRLLDDLYNLGLREARLKGNFFSSTGFFGNSLLVGLLMIGTNMVRTNQMSLGELSSFIMYAVYSGSSFFTLSNFYAELMTGVGASSRVFEMLDVKPEIKANVGKEAVKLEEYAKAANKDNLVVIDGDIEFKDIEFHYPTRASHQIFENLNLKVNKGDHVCLVGPSGCGKSTIIQLLFRHYDTQAGQILINGHDLKELNLQSLRSHIGLVQQEPMLFSGTIRENITYGKLGATDEEVHEICKLANCYDFIMSFPDKFDTVIGAKGAQLSGGQKQRVALLRMLLNDPEIIILDEATSALDNNSELAINDTLRLLHDKTIISVAHRLSTIKMSDKIIVLGRKDETVLHNDVLEVGTYDELINDPESQLVRLLKQSGSGADTEVELTVEEEEKEQEKEQ